MSRTASRPVNRRPALIAGFMTLATIAATGCGIIGVRGEGVTASDARFVEPFERVEVGYSIKLDLQIGPTPQVEIRAQPNILPLITTTVEGGRLVITSDAELAPSVEVTAVVVTPSLEGLGLSGSSHGVVAGLALDDLDVDLSGAARLDATGSADRVYLSSSGGAEANLTDLAIEELDIQISGGSTVEARVSDTVRGSASGGARVRVTGDSDVRVHTSGGATVDPD